MQNYMFDLSTPKGGLEFSIERTGVFHREDEQE